LLPLADLSEFFKRKKTMAGKSLDNVNQFYYAVAIKKHSVDIPAGQHTCRSIIEEDQEPARSRE
jgi:hypothetical protein